MKITPHPLLAPVSGRWPPRRHLPSLLSVFCYGWLTLSPLPVPGQGLVKFLNASTTLVSSFGIPISGPAGSFYFALLTAPLGTISPQSFTFSGIYATNTGVAGRLQGGAGTGASVPGWEAGTSRSFLVCGWPSTLGPTWNPNWIWGGQIGMSMIASGVAGGIDSGGSPLPPLPLFSSTTISNGFDIRSCLSPDWHGILVEPTNQTVNVGDPAVFRVVAQACPPPYFQWYLNGSPIAGAVQDTYTIPHAQPTDAGTYYANLWNPAWPIYSGTNHLSQRVGLIVRTTPVITFNPQSEFVAPGANIDLHVQAAGPPPLQYQWWFNGRLLENATNSSLSLGNFQNADLGAYTVVVTNTYGSTTSCPASLKLMPQPPPLVAALSTDMGSSPPVESPSLRVRFGSCAAGSAWLQTTVFDKFRLGTHDLGQGFVVTAANDTNFASLARIFSNGTSDWAGYEFWTGHGGDGSCSPGDLTLFQGRPAGWNGIDLQGFEITSFILQLDQLVFTTYAADIFTHARVRVFITYQPLRAPSVLRGPATQTAEVGSDAHFSVLADGSAPLFYRWSLNGADIGPPTTNNWLTVEDVQSTNAGAYIVIVSNIVGSATSSPGMLSVIPPVNRRLVPGLSISSQTGATLNLESAPALGPEGTWALLSTVLLTNSPQWYFDTTDPLPGQRLYRSWQGDGGTGSLLDLHFIPAINLTGAIGSSVRLEYINQFGPTDAWLTLGTVALTNASQLYFDTSILRQPPRLYRIVPLP